MTDKLNLAVLNLVESRQLIGRFLRGDKSAGIKKAWYYHHVQKNIPMACDTRKEMLEAVDVMNSQGITLYKTIKPSRATILRHGAVDATLFVYRNDNQILQRANNDNGDFVVDTVAISFDYLPADCETCLVEVIFQKNTATQKKKKR